jgi:hypothetical protein
VIRIHLKSQKSQILPLEVALVMPTDTFFGFYETGTLGLASPIHD